VFNVKQKVDSIKAFICLFLTVPDLKKFRFDLQEVLVALKMSPSS